MDYVYINAENIAAEVVLETDPTFPEFSVYDRFSPEYVSRLVNVPNPNDAIGMIYDWKSETFSMPPEPETEPMPEPEPESHIIDKLYAAYQGGVDEA